MLDCCQDSDGGVALVVTSIERGAALKRSPVIIHAALVSGRDTDRGASRVQRIRSTGGHADFLAWISAGPTLASATSPAKRRSSVVDQVDILVNNAGPTRRPRPSTWSIMTSTRCSPRRQHRCALRPECGPDLVQGGTRFRVVVNIGSWMARVGSPIGAMYTATKATDEQLTRSWATEFGPRAVWVNTVAPDVPLIPGNAADRSITAITAITPAGSVVLPSDIAATVAFLASQDAAQIHGSTPYVDGGISATRLQ